MYNIRLLIMYIYYICVHKETKAPEGTPLEPSWDFPGSPGPPGTAWNSLGPPWACRGTILELP